MTYSLFDIPSNLMLDRIGVRKTLLRIMALWGILTAMQMFIRSAGELYVLRLLFGAAEAASFQASCSISPTGFPIATGAA